MLLCVDKISSLIDSQIEILQFYDRKDASHSNDLSWGAVWNETLLFQRWIATLPDLWHLLTAGKRLNCTTHQPF
jgi:hypothetical protein